LVVDRPVESEVTPLALVLMPVEAEVEREETLLFVVDSPVDEDVDSELMPDDAEVESEPT
jgi:hypothetical protein